MSASEKMVVFWSCVLVVTFNFALSKLTVPVDQNHNQSNLINSAIEIANENFNFRKYSVVISKDVEEIYVNTFLKFYRGTLVVETKRSGEAPAQVVLILKSYLSFMRILNKLKPDLKGQTLMNGWTKFLIILLNSSYKMGAITKTLWNNDGINVLIITSVSNKTAMYTYLPYKYNLDCHNTQPYLIGLWNKNSRLDLYPDKVRNMKGCPVYISTNKLLYPHAEQKILVQSIAREVVNLLMRKMHYTPFITRRNYLSIDSDRAKNASDSLNDVISGRANLSFGIIPLGMDAVLDYSNQYFAIRFGWIAPPPTIGQVNWRLLSPLSGYIWLFLLLSLAFVTSLPFSLKITPVRRFCYHHFRNIDKLQGVSIRIWAVLLGQPIQVAPKRFRDFYIISIWMWFTFVIRNAYQSVLIGVLKSDTIEGNFASIQEAKENGFRYGGQRGILDHFEFDQSIRDDYEIISADKFLSVIEDVLDGRKKFVLATSLDFAWASYCMAKGKNQEECGHVLADSIVTLPFVVTMKKHSPFKRSLDMWISRFNQGMLLRGLAATPTYSTISSDPTPLTRHQILSCVFLLALGYTISTIVFVLEILGENFKKFRHKAKA